MVKKQWQQSMICLCFFGSISRHFSLDFDESMREGDEAEVVMVDGVEEEEEEEDEDVVVIAREDLSEGIGGIFTSEELEFEEAEVSDIKTAFTGRAISN